MCVCVVCDGRYVEPADAREMLDNLKMMCPPPTGCKSLDYLREAMYKAGSTFTEGAYVRELQWGNCFNEDCSPVNITVGDAVIFKYSASHDVVEVATAAEYAGCTALTNVVGSTSAGASGYKRTFDKVGTHYFVCGRGTHCKQGQKTVVHVHEARKVASTGGTAPSYSNKPPSVGGDSTVAADSSAAASSHDSFAAAILASVLAAAVLVLA